MPLPDTANLISARHIIRENRTNSDDPKKQTKCCLIGHASKLCSGDANITNDDFDVVCETVRSVVVKEAKISDFSIVTANDDESIPKTFLARVWNRTLYKLGYVVNNPESEPLCWPKKK